MVDQIFRDIIDAFDLVISTISEFAKNEKGIELSVDFLSDFIFIIYNIISFKIKSGNSAFEIIQKVSQAQYDDNFPSREAQCLSWIYGFLSDHTMSSILSNIISDEQLLINYYNPGALVLNEDVCLKFIQDLEENCETLDFRFPPLIQTVIETKRKLKIFNSPSAFYYQYKNKFEYKTDSIITDTENNSLISTFENKSDSFLDKNKASQFSIDESNFISNRKENFYSIIEPSEENSKTHPLESKPFNENERYICSNFIDDYEKLIDKFYSNLGVVKERNDNPYKIIDHQEEEKLINKLIELKKDILNSNITFAKRVNLVEEIIGIRLKLFLKKNDDLPQKPLTKLDHSLVFSEITEIRSYYHISEICYVCNKKFMRSFNTIQKCLRCPIYLHEKCESNLDHDCFEIDRSTLIMNLEICPEIGLARQKFRCGFCKIYLPKNGLKTVKKCDYSGLYYCHRCHLGYEHAIPARILKNFDFSLYPVSITSFNAIENLWHSRTIHLYTINPELVRIFSVVKRAEELRSNLSELRIYVEKCHIMNKIKILKPIGNRIHLLEKSDTYTLNDLFCLQTEKLLVDMRKTILSILYHIKNCSMCYDMCHMCLICRKPDPLFRFARNTDFCSICDTIYHRKCLKEKECLICSNRRLSFKSF